VSVILFVSSCPSLGINTIYGVSCSHESYNAPLLLFFHFEQGYPVPDEHNELKYTLNNLKSNLMIFMFGAGYLH